MIERDVWNNKLQSTQKQRDLQSFYRIFHLDSHSHQSVERQDEIWFALGTAAKLFMGQKKKKYMNACINTIIN